MGVLGDRCWVIGFRIQSSDPFQDDERQVVMRMNVADKRTDGVQKPVADVGGGKSGERGEDAGNPVYPKKLSFPVPRFRKSV